MKKMAIVEMCLRIRFLFAAWNIGFAFGAARLVKGCEYWDEPSRGPNRKLGQTSYFCPVAYRDQRVLKPGDPEIVASYKGLAYYFGGEAEMAKFMQNPEKYVDDGIQDPLKVSYAWTALTRAPKSADKKNR